MEILLENSNTSSNNKKDFKILTQKCIDTCDRLRKLLIKLKQEIPEIITKIELIRNEVDNRNTKVKSTTGIGATTGLIGGTLIVAGFVGAVPTLGASLGLTIAGTVISGVGAMTSSGAGIVSFMKNRKSKKEARELVIKVASITSEIQVSYKQLEQQLSTLGDAMVKVKPELECMNKKDKFSMGWDVVSFVKSPPGVITNIALTVRTGTVAVSDFIQVIGNIAKVCGKVFLVLGILADCFNLGQSVYCLLLNKKCGTSITLSQQLDDLDNLESKIDEFLECLPK